MGPLSAYRILDLTTFTQGGAATGLLRDLGADVIKVENPAGGDGGRNLTLVDGVSSFFLPQNRGKRSIALDIRADQGRDLLLRLAERCDAFVHNFRPGVAERLRIGYEDVRAVNPGIVYAEASGLGSRGPDAGFPTVDIVGQARGGLISVTGEETAVPAGAIISDYTGAMHLAIGVLAALLHRERTGQGQRVEGSMLGSMVALQTWEFTHYLLTGESTGRAGRGHRLLGGFWNIFETRDGAIVLAGIPPKAWEGLAELLHRPELVTDERLSSAAARRGQVEDAVAIVRAALRERDTAELLPRLHALDVRCSAVQDYAALAQDPQVAANGYIVEADHPRLGRIRMVGHPLRFSETQVEVASVAPELGQHTAEVLAWLNTAAGEDAAS
jgi:crotonobetainyl-CoA:carnitine CoA-transferase CaiB-like acyl-CoA transferase